MEPTWPLHHCLLNPEGLVAPHLLRFVKKSEFWSKVNLKVVIVMWKMCRSKNISVMKNSRVLNVFTEKIMAFSKFYSWLKL